MITFLWGFRIEDTLLPFSTLYTNFKAEDSPDGFLYQRQNGHTLSTNPWWLLFFRLVVCSLRLLDVSVSVCRSSSFSNAQELFSLTVFRDNFKCTFLDLLYVGVFSKPFGSLRDHMENPFQKGHTSVKHFWSFQPIKKFTYLKLCFIVQCVSLVLCNWLPCFI